MTASVRILTPENAVDNTTPAPLGTAAAGTSKKAARADHVHPLPALGDLLPATAADQGKVPTVDDTGVYTLATPTGGGGSAEPGNAYALAVWDGTPVTLPLGVRETEVHLTADTTAAVDDGAAADGHEYWVLLHIQTDGDERTVTITGQNLDPVPVPIATEAYIAIRAYGATIVSGQSVPAHTAVYPAWPDLSGVLGSGTAGQTLGVKADGSIGFIAGAGSQPYVDLGSADDGDTVVVPRASGIFSVDLAGSGTVKLSPAEDSETDDTLIDTTILVSPSFGGQPAATLTVADPAGSTLLTLPIPADSASSSYAIRYLLSKTKRILAGVTYGAGLGPVPVAVPASATAAGAPGQITADSNYVYVCTAANTWKRAALAAW